MTGTITINKVTELAHNWGRLDNYQVTHLRRDGTQQTVQRDHQIARVPDAHPDGQEQQHTLDAPQTAPPLQEQRPHKG